MHGLAQTMALIYFTVTGHFSSASEKAFDPAPAFIEPSSYPGRISETGVSFDFPRVSAALMQMVVDIAFD